MDDVLEPKYWNKKTKKVEINNVELSKTTTTLDSILGTYRWFYYSFANRDGDTEPDSGYITLAKSKEKATPGSITGSVQVHEYEAPFKGLMRVKEYNSQRSRKGFWGIKNIEWDLSEQNGFGMCEVKDDNGNPFLVWESGDPSYHDCGMCCRESDFCFYLGKKVAHEGDRDWESADEQAWLLTEDEQVRLGMSLSEMEVEELATKGYISDTSDEDSPETSELNKSEEGSLKRKAVTDDEGGKRKVPKVEY